MYSWESLHRSDSNEYTQHTIITENRAAIPKWPPFASWPGAIFNPQWLELPISRTSSMVSKMLEPLRFDYNTYYNVSAQAMWVAWTARSLSCMLNSPDQPKQGPVPQSVVSLTSSLRVISLIVLADSIYNIDMFCWKNVSSCKSYSHFSAKNFSIFAYHLMQILTNC